MRVRPREITFASLQLFSFCLVPKESLVSYKILVYTIELCDIGAMQIGTLHYIHIFQLLSVTYDEVLTFPLLGFHSIHKEGIIS